jgi:excisionase family DNA binding protein
MVAQDRPRPIVRGEAVLYADEVAARLGVTVATIYRWWKAGRLPLARPGAFHGRLTFLPSDVARIER